jgi:preprotein translocase subunit SecE
MSKTTDYLKEVRAEANNITWPSRNQTIFYTIAVLVISAAIAYYLGFFDSVFSKGLEWLLNHK